MAIEQLFLKLKNNFPLFAKHALKIVVKDGSRVPLELNRAQLYLHERLEHQLATKGKVRAIVIKGRQQGISTYVEGRFYHKLWRTDKSLTAFILTHQRKSTDSLFNKAKEFHDFHPVELGQPELDKSNANELIFTHNRGNYSLATAGSKDVGRGTTIQLFHGSEVALWENADNHIAASGEAVGDTAGTEIILESTANGIGNYFYNETMQALSGDSDYEVIFLPWYWQPEYTNIYGADWKPSEQWLDYARIYNLSYEQLYWAYLKNRGFANSIGQPNLDEPCWKFKQEYPCNIHEAFQSTGSSFISPDYVMKARKSPTVPGHGPIIFGVDPARGGETGDAFAIIDRCGKSVGTRVCERFDPQGNLIFAANYLIRLIDKYKPDFVNIDDGGLGSGVTNYLQARGYGAKLNPVQFGSKAYTMGPTGSPIYSNRRAEMYDEMREWFTEGGAKIPDDDLLMKEICVAETGPGKTEYNTSGQLVIESKNSIKSRMKGKSPDLCDALALTFAVPTHYLMPSRNTQPKVRNTAPNSTGY